MDKGAQMLWLDKRMIVLEVACVPNSKNLVAVDKKVLPKIKKTKIYISKVLR